MNKQQHRLLKPTIMKISIVDFWIRDPIVPPAIYDFNDTPPYVPPDDCSSFGTQSTCGSDLESESPTDSGDFTSSTLPDPGFFMLNGLGQRLKRWLFGTQVPHSVEQLANELVEDSDTAMHLAYTHDSDVLPTPRQRMRFITDLVDECKIAIEGVGVESEANRLVARRYLSKKMVARGMRPQHIKTMLPIAVEMVFVPNEFEVIAHQLRYSKALLDRKDLAGVKYTPRYQPSIFNWFGAKRPVPVAVQG